MDLNLIPDMYQPGIDNNGNYIDEKPYIRHGIMCPCGSRKDKVYNDNSKFTTHMKTKVHQKWLESLNNNKANFYVELLKTKEVNKNQQQIITRLENEIANRNNTIDYLTKQLLIKESENQTTIEVDLLDIN